MDFTNILFPMQQTVLPKREFHITFPTIFQVYLMYYTLYSSIYNLQVHYQRRLLKGLIMEWAKVPLLEVQAWHATL